MNEFKIVLDENFGTYVTIPEASRKSMVRGIR